MTHFLDITGDTCPMTFVKVKLRLEEMGVGEVLEVRLNAGEPLENVPRSVGEEGHEVSSPVVDGEGEVFRIWVTKRGGG